MGFVDHDRVVGSSSSSDGSVLIHLRSAGADDRRRAPLLALVNHNLLIPTLHAAKCFVPTAHTQTKTNHNIRFTSNG